MFSLGGAQTPIPQQEPTIPDRLTDPQVQTDLLLYRLYRVHITASRLVVQVCEQDYGLTRREWRVLSFLSEHEGALSSELAEHAMLDRARTSRTLTRLEEKKLIRRQPKPSDRREVHVFLSDEGRRVYQSIFPRVAAINSELASALSPAERRQLDHAINTLQDRVHGMVAAFKHRLPPMDSGE
ncbi:MarR family winged helix-turn-helix transcriptional regulator [Hydrogenophaga sp.]|uniref:MarR family winged helix-turn-helix transcriptional regulator n=1 Tax=Hydrogenophaga sp. TaxID=1904254 RepID=UPI003F6BBA3C